MINALVLAGSRGGIDPVAAHAGVSQKCLAPLLDKAMIGHVCDTLLALDRIAHIRIAAEDGSELQHIAGLEHPAIEIAGCEPTPSLTVAAALEALGTPLLVTTADHPLLTPEMLTFFLDEAERNEGDVSVGLVSSDVILSAYPENKRTYLCFRDGRFSGANLFFMRDDAAMNAVRFWRRVERDRKKPWRIAKAMGPGLLLLYLLRIGRLDQVMKRASLIVGARADAVRLPFAEAAIDVDKVEDLMLAKTILERRSAF